VPPEFLPPLLGSAYPTIREAVSSAAAATEKADALLIKRRRTAVSDLRDAHHEVRDQLERVVGALEGMRVELLRLREGVGGPDDLVGCLEAARQIGSDAEALLRVSGEA
jgi:hypothetical protein